MKRLLGILLLLHWSGAAFAIETTIRVLGVIPSQVTGQVTYMQAQLEYLRQSWINTQMPTSSGISVEILNGGTPVSAALPGLPAVIGTSAWAAAQPTIIDLRNDWQADIVVLLTNVQDGHCGVAEQYFNNGTFIPNAQGMDLNGSEVSYVAVVATACLDHVAAHEFGHLLGGGHVSAPSNQRLYSDSRAYVYNTLDPWPINIWTSTATVLVDSTECPTLDAIFCIFESHYSRNAPLQGDGSHQNARAFNTTARSVANYRVAPTPTPPSPTLLPPINVHGFLISTCVSGWTRHQVHWAPDPQTTAQVVAYEVWFSQPPGQPVAYGWNVPAIQEFSDVYVIGADSRIYVKACTTTECSNLSVSSYLAQFTCNF